MRCGYATVQRKPTGYLTLSKGRSRVFTEEGQRQIRERIQVYKNNAKVLMDALDQLGIWYCGGKNCSLYLDEVSEWNGKREFFPIICFMKSRWWELREKALEPAARDISVFLPLARRRDTKEAAGRLVKLLAR